MGVGGNVSREDGSAGKGPGDDVQGGCPGSDHIWEKIWVVTDPMMKVLEGFHHSISRRIMGMMVRRGAGG